jgi:formate hydrogenlyase subunit 6/NADH:ubiquinone oxidoreductase subunit I
MPYFQMSMLALKWALKKPPTSQYPFQPRVLVQGSRGLLAFNRDTCVFCSVCAKKCPTGAITVNRAKKQWSIDRLLCISCNACADACPKDSLTLRPEHSKPTVTKDREYF